MLIIGSMCLAVVVIIASGAGISVAIPFIGETLQASQSELQWIIDAFNVVLAASLLPAGALGDRFGRKRLMLIGFVIFVAALVWSAATTDTTTLIVMRGIAGAGAALIFPGTLSTITNVIPDESRGKAVAAWAASASLGGTLGSLGAGGLIERYWFGSIFLAMAVVSVVAAIVVTVAVPETSDPADSNLDPIGSVLSIVGIGGLVLGIIEGPVKGWTDTITVAGFVAGIIGLLGFVVWELRTEHPLLDLELFERRGFSTGSVSIFLQFFASFGFFFVATQHLAFVFDYSPFIVAAALLPIGVTIPLGSALAPGLSKRLGRGIVGASGLLLLALGSFMFTLLTTGSNYWAFGTAVLVYGLGFGLAAPPATEAIVESLPAEEQGVASAINDVMRELGGAVGIAIIGSAFSAGYKNEIDNASASFPPGLADTVREAPGIGLGAAAEAGPDAPRIVELVQTSVNSGFGIAMWASASATILGAVYVLIRSPRGGDETPALGSLEATVDDRRE
ncbi:MFS transporter [Ilumatobacter sp.]|uniref:MFS transporter n=1 Tax=Ilumatobacter sp. TaxID=1967498 RepID=UPI003B51D68A